MSKMRVVCTFGVGVCLSQCVINGFQNHPGPAIAFAAIGLFLAYTAWVFR